VHVNYEYILAGFIIVLVLTTTQVYSAMLLNRKIADWEQAAGYQTAEGLLDMLLLSPGEPSNWYDFSDHPQLLGLASVNAFEEYALDPRKVERLTPNSTHYIPPSTLRSLLGISSTIGLSLRIVPALNLTITYVELGNYLLTVRDLKGLLVPNVNVTAYYVSTRFNPCNDTDIQLLERVTSIYGNASLSFDPPKENAALVVCVGQSDVRAIATYPEDALLTVQGNHVISSPRPAVLTVYSTTGSFFGYKREVTSRYVKVDGYTYYAELMLWG